MRIALVTPLRSCLREPQEGGLEVLCLDLGRALRARGHHVEIFAGHGSDPALGVSAVEPLPAVLEGRRDISNDPLLLAAERRCYEGLIMRIRGAGFDVVHDNSMHDLPILLSSTLTAPVVTTLHTPPITRVVMAMQAVRRPSDHYVAVSRSTAEHWRHADPDILVIPNGVDLDRWCLGAGGEVPVWSGRLVEEKGVMLAIRAAQLAGTGLRIAGRRQDPVYFRDRVQPHLGHGISYVGHLAQSELAALVRSSSAALVTPLWDEPYGLVAAEAIASGTPVAGFARGALTEFVTEANGVLVDRGDVPRLARAIRYASQLDRAVVRSTAEARCSLRLTAERYEALFQRLIRRAAGSRPTAALRFG
jgi:glycosyltransferase involved in cell wall biosynthesis